MESIWRKETEIGKGKSLQEDIETRAVVIGAGMAGILTAYHLEQAGIPTVILEADRIGSGQTKNTTAKITSQHSLIYHRLIQTFGRKMAEHYARANEAAISAYERLVSELEIDCDFVRCPAYLYSQEEVDPLKREVEAAKELGIKASFERDSELPFLVVGATRFENQARFQPLKFLEKIAEKVTVYEQAKVLKVEGNRVKTDRGCVTADHIVFATHFPFLNIPGYYFARMYQERSYVLALEGTQPLEGMYLGIDQEGLSFRAQGDLLLLGGGSHRTGLNKQGGQYEKLRGKARAFYPACHEAACWSAQDCMTLDGIPYIGRFSNHRPNWYVATGFGKWGMTTSMVSARILTALITGQDCPEADIFSPQRQFMPQAAKTWMTHSAHTVKGLAKRLLPAKNEEIVPTCPHMGCRLEWNPEEMSYDCSCHGSRFDKTGHLLDGPAQTDCQRRKHVQHGHC